MHKDLHEYVVFRVFMVVTEFGLKLMITEGITI